MAAREAGRGLGRIRVVPASPIGEGALWLDGRPVGWVRRVSAAGREFLHVGLVEGNLPCQPLIQGCGETELAAARQAVAQARIQAARLRDWATRVELALDGVGGPAEGTAENAERAKNGQVKGEGVAALAPAGVRHE